MKKTDVAICWFRRDLRISDNVAFWQALNSGLPVIPLFIFDTTILDRLEQGSAHKRVNFIYNALSYMEEEFKKVGSFLLNIKGNPIDVFNYLANGEFNKLIEIKAVYCNKDYEQSAIERDALVEALLAKKGIPLHSFKDQVIFEKDQILKKDGTPYSVYTPYSRKWIEKLESSPAEHLREYKTEPMLGKLLSGHSIRTSLPTIEEIGFAPAQLNIQLPYSIPQHIIENYSQTRNFPAIEGTSGISPHLRFGTISIREAVRFAIELSNITWLKELIWRDFFKMILFQFPYVQNQPFKSKYSFIEWRNNPNELEAWCNGNTGYPIVDAGMRELNATGLMHNRVRMITASFLVKHLLIDWRVGEVYFAEKLLDYDLSSNNGNWQWAASTGCDAVPYFRIFNPYEQARKFDPNNEYIKKWVPELGSKTYPAPICDHKEARERALKTYKKALS